MVRRDADNAGGRLLAIVEPDEHAARARNNVEVRDHVPGLIPDKTRACALLHLVAEERAIVAFRKDVDDGRCGRREHICGRALERGQLAARRHGSGIARGQHNALIERAGGPKPCNQQDAKDKQSSKQSVRHVVSLVAS